MLKTYRSHLVAKKHLAGDVFLFRFVLDEPKEIIFSPGQYVILQIPQKNSQELKRLYSIASSPQLKDSFELIVKCIRGGIGSDYLRRLKLGEKVCFQGPAGMFTLRVGGDTLKKNNNDKIFLVTGTGIAPIRSMIYQIQTKGLQVKSYLFWGLKYYRDIYLFDEFKAWAEEGCNFEFWICLSREKSLENIPEKIKKHFVLGRVNVGFNNFLKKKTEKDLRLNKTDFYICGSRLVVESLNQYLLEKRINKDNIHFEKF